MSPIYNSIGEPLVQAPDTLAREDLVGIMLSEIHIPGTPYKSPSRTERYAYWRRIRDVKKVLPIAEEFSRTITGTYKYAETLPTKRECRAHLVHVKEELIRDYTPRMKDLTLGQGLLPIKLVDKQTNSTGYEIVKSIYGELTTMWYNLFAEFYGGGLDTKFDPEYAGNDAITERITYLWRYGLLQHAALLQTLKRSQYPVSLISD